MNEIIHYNEALEILGNDLYFTEGSNSTNFNPEENQLLRKNFAAFLQSKMDWIKGHFDPVLEMVSIKTKCSYSFELMSELINPFCQELAFKMLGIIDNSERAQLLNEAADVFYMNEGDFEKEKAFAAADRLAVFFNCHCKGQMEKGENDLAADFAADHSFKSPAHLIQLFIGTVTSLPLLLGNQIVLLLEKDELKNAFLENPERLLNEIIRLSGPSKYLYRIAGPGCPHQEAAYLRLNIELANTDKSIFSDDFNSNRMPNLSFGYGAHACLGAGFIRALSLFFIKSFFQMFPNSVADIVSKKIGGSRNVQGLLSLQVIS